MFGHVQFAPLGPVDVLDLVYDAKDQIIPDNELSQEGQGLLVWLELAD